MHDVVIIGAGPIGLELAVALQHAGVDYAHVEAGSIGSSIAWWAPGTRYFSSPERIAIAGVPLVTPDESKANREQYLAYLRSVVMQFGLRVRTGERVVRATRDDDGFTLHTVRSHHGVGGPREAARHRTGRAPGDEADQVIRACRVVLAHGNLHWPRRVDIPGEDLPHVSHFAGEPHECFGGRLLIIGGKNSAVETALRSYRCGIDVTLSYRGTTFDPRRVKYWLRPEIEWLIEKQRLGWYPETMPVRIHADRVELASVSAPETIVAEVPADFVRILTGYVQDPVLFEQLGVRTAGPTNAPVVDDATMESPDAPGVFVAGTAMGGSQQRARVFIENSHIHVDRIVRAITGSAAPWAVSADFAALEES